jgi:hypothetical protein
MVQKVRIETPQTLTCTVTAAVVKSIGMQKRPLREKGTSLDLDPGFFICLDANFLSGKLTLPDEGTKVGMKGVR